MNKKTIEQIEVKGKRVFVRCDFNVPIDEEGKITDENRIIEALPTIKYLMSSGAKIILCSHLGRPKGAFNKKYSLKPVAQKLSEHLNIKVTLAADVIGEDAQAKAKALKDGEILLLENVRFHAEEEKNDDGFSKALANFADIFVNDAFGTAHRPHSSTAGIAKFCKQNVAGYLIEKEVKLLGDALITPDRPFVAVLGGAKVSDKIGVIESLMKKADSILIGGAMAYTFLAAMGVAVGNSRIEADKVELAAEILKTAKKKNVQFVLPIDHIAATEFSKDASPVSFKNHIQDGYMGLDIGSETCKLFGEIIAKAKTVLWNGPMGVFEFDNFAVGTNCVAQAIANNKDATTIIGGGDSAAAIEKSGLKSKITHVSTGGGASLEFIEGIVLPGIACLDDIV